MLDHHAESVTCLGLLDHLGEASMWYLSYRHLISQKGNDLRTDWSRLWTLETGLGLHDHLGETAIWRSSYKHLSSEKGKDSRTDWSGLRSLDIGLGLHDHLCEASLCSGCVQRKGRN